MLDFSDELDEESDEEDEELIVSLLLLATSSSPFIAESPSRFLGVFLKRDLYFSL